MRNIILCLVVVIALVGGTLAGTFAGFVDTEESQGNLVQAGISDLLINNSNDPNVPIKVYADHAVPGKSIDFWADAYNWGKCNGGFLSMHFKDVVSVEWGAKLHGGVLYVYDGVTNLGGGIPNGYAIATATQSQGTGVWSSEPEKIAEVGGGYVGNFLIATNNPYLKGEDYATGIADNLEITITVPKIGPLAVGDQTLGNPDTNNDGTVNSTEYGAWVTNGNRWEVIPSLTGTLSAIACDNDLLGFLATQTKTFIHIDVKLDQLSAYPVGSIPDYDNDGVAGDADDVLLNYWPTNALQGDYARWTMLFTLFTDDPS
jgi:hypothetical protein